MPWVVAWWGLLWAANNSILGLGEGWSALHTKSMDKMVWDMLFYAILWTVWIARNALVSENSAITWDRVRIENGFVVL